MGKNMWLGLVEIGVGALLASPADEAGLAILSGGSSLAISPAQISVTGAIGILMVLDGLRRV